MLPPNHACGNLVDGMFATFKLLFVYLFFGIPAGIVGIPYTVLTGNIRPLYRFSMWIVRTGVRAAGIRVEVSGLEQIPAGRPCIFMSNHVSNLDPTVLLPSLPGMSSVLLKKELMKIPILGTAMRIGKYVPVGRGGSRAEAQASVVAAADALNSGLHILVFAEGTRAKDGRLSTFKKGPFFLAQQTGAPIVPIAIAGTQTMMRKGSAAITPGVATVRFLAPIESTDYKSREELMRVVHEAIAAALPDEMKPLTPGSPTELSS